MNISIDPQVTERYDNVDFVYIVGHNVKIIPTPPREKKLARAVESELRARFQDLDLYTDPNIRGWALLAERMGIESADDLPAPIGLASQVIAGKNLPKVNNVVDAANIAALRFLCPVGAFDLDKLSGDVALRLTTQSEPFIPMFSKEIGLVPGEIVYSDEQKIFSRYSKDAHETRITEDTANILCVIDALPNVERPALLERRSFLLQLLKDICGGAATFVEGVPSRN